MRTDGCRVIAVDNSAAMVERCREYLNGQDSMFQELLPVQVIEGDILALEFQPASVVALNFTLQFIAPSQRTELLTRIRQSLLPGGALILSAIAISTLLWADLSNRYVWTVLVVTLLFGGIGWVDERQEMLDW